jgi:hypothetical protein
MPFVAHPNVAKVTVLGELYGQDVENVWYVQTAAPPDIVEMENIAATFQTAYASIAAALSQDISFSQVIVRYLGDIAGPEFSFAISPPQTGGVATGAEPGNVCLCVSLRTALAGRRFRGRKYFSGLPTGTVVANRVTDATATAIRNAVQNLIANLAVALNPMQILSVVGNTAVPVTTAVLVDQFADSQRRRLTGRGS